MTDTTLVVLGETGAGKSSTLNTLAERDGLFLAHSSDVSVTEETLVLEATHPTTGRILKLIDTQGFMDTEGRDAEFTRDVQETLKALPHVSAFLFVMNGTIDRSAKYKEILQTYNKMFGATFLDRLIFCVTFLPYRHPLSGKKEAKKKQDAVKERLAAMMINVFGKSDVPIVFIDNAVMADGGEAEFEAGEEDSDDDDRETKKELMARAHAANKKDLRAQVETLMTFARQSTFDTSTISDAVLPEPEMIKAREAGSQAMGKQLEKFEKRVSNAKSDARLDSYSQFADIYNYQDILVDGWIADVGDHAEYVYDIFDNLRQQLVERLSRVKREIFGAEFVERQMKTIKEVTASDKEAMKQCPHCSVIWWNEGGCNQRRCGHHGAPSWGTFEVPVPGRGRNNIQHGCGKKFEWSCGRPVTQAYLQQWVKPEKEPEGKQAKTVSKDALKTKRRSGDLQKKKSRASTKLQRRMASAGLGRKGKKSRK